MRILWLTNVALPQIADKLHRQVGYSGGWLIGLGNELINDNSTELIVCFPILFEKRILEGNVGSLQYYTFPQTVIPTKYNKKVEKYLEIIINEANPDIINIFGTEFPHSLAMVNVCERLGIINKVIITIQGLCSLISKHYYSDLPQTVIYAWTLRDILKCDNIRQQKFNFFKRGIFETEAVKKVKNVIGRTDWDRSCINLINPNTTYHFCNESLRNSFYEYSWDINVCDRYSIFVSQSEYPIKGFHYLLEAMPEIIRRFPKTHVYIAGYNISKKITNIDRLNITSYGKYINKIMKKYLLADYITFVGELNESAMCKRFLKSHVFVSPSSIENSSNSVGESMILGVPTISSDVGGIKNLLVHDADGYIYQHNAPYMLAYYICNIFMSDKLAIKFSVNARIHALKTHDRLRNLETIKMIYEQTLSTKEKSNTKSE